MRDISHAYTRDTLLKNKEHIRKYNNFKKNIANFREMRGKKKDVLVFFFVCRFH